MCDGTRVGGIVVRCNWGTEVLQWEGEEGALQPACCWATQGKGRKGRAGGLWHIVGGKWRAGWRGSCCWHLQWHLHIVAGVMAPIRSTRQGCLQPSQPSQHHQQRLRDSVDDMDKYMMACNCYCAVLLFAAHAGNAHCDIASASENVCEVGSRGGG